MLFETLAGPPGSKASPRRRGVVVAAKCLALLVVPLLSWLFFSPPEAAVAHRKAHVDEAARRDPARVGGPASAPHTTAGAAPTEVESTPPAGAALAVDGEVLDPQGKPAADASVTCKVGDQTLEAQSDGSGRFGFPKAAVGCEATATKHGFGPSPPVALAASGNRLRLEPPAGIAGHVVDESGVPVMTYWIAVESFEPAGSPPRANTKEHMTRPPRKIALEVNDVDGAFEWDDLAPGRYALAVSVPSRPFARARDIDVRPAAVTRGVRIVAGEGTTVVGKIIEARTGTPLEGSIVSAELGLGVDLGLKGVPAFSHAGDFTLLGAPREVFDLHVLHPGYREAIVTGLKPPANGEPLRVDVKMWRGDEPAFDGGGGPPPK